MFTKMDTISELLKFQIEKLDYQFRDVDLLIKALTHSADNYENIYKFPFKFKTHQRLRVVGEAVLKLVASEYAIRSSKSLRDDQGTWTVRKSDLLQEDKQTKVGQNLLLNVAENSVPSCSKLIRIHSSNLNNPDFKIRYADFVKALFGAMFLDSKEETGILNCFKLFVKLWDEFLGNEQIHNTLEDFFPSPEPEVLKYWKEYGKYKQDVVVDLWQTIGVVVKPCLLWEAIIHISFYDPVVNEPPISTCRRPDYERLEFLGDAVLDVVLVQIFWISYKHYDFTSISMSARKLAEFDKQKEIYKQLNLEKFVLKRNVQNWENYGDIVESVIGALYVDNGFVLTKTFVVDKWKLPRVELLSDLERRLNYRFTNNDVLTQSLTHHSFYTNHKEKANCKQKLARNKSLGKAVINLLAIEYAFKSGKISARAGGIEAKMMSLCSRVALKQISDNLQLCKLVRINDALKTSKTTYDSYEDFVFPIFGAVSSELVFEEKLVKLREIFYRLWNPLLKNIPERNLISCFIPEPLIDFEILRIEQGHLLENDNKFKFKVESSLNYNFQNFVLLQQAITPRIVRSYTSNVTFGDTERFALIGKYGVKYYAVLQTDIELPTPSSPRELEAFLEKIAQDIIDDAKYLFPCKILHEFWKGINQQQQQILTPSRESLLPSAVLGAIYVDMEVSGANTLTERWTKYLEMLQKRAAVTREHILKEKAKTETRTKILTVQVFPEARIATTTKTLHSPIRILQAQPESAPKPQSTVLPLSYNAETRINMSKTHKYTVPIQNIEDSKYRERLSEISAELQARIKQIILREELEKMKKRRSKATQTEQIQKLQSNYYSPDPSTKSLTPARNTVSQSTFAESSKPTHINTENMYFLRPHAQNSFPSAENKHPYEVKHVRHIARPEIHSENRNVNYRTFTSSSRTSDIDSLLAVNTGFYSGYNHNNRVNNNVIRESAASGNTNNAPIYHNTSTVNRRDTTENTSSQNVHEAMTFSEYVGVFSLVGILYAIWLCFGQ